MMHIYSYVGGGYEGDIVKVEVDLRRGIPGMDIVGLPDSAVKESRERVRAAIRNSGFRMPRERILINLAPAGVKKMGTGLDLPIATAILAAADQLSAEGPDSLLILGELGLSGQVRGVPGVLAALLSAGFAEKGVFMVPGDNLAEAKVLGETDVLGVEHLKQLPHIFTLLLHGKRELLEEKRSSPEVPSVSPWSSCLREAGTIDFETHKYRNLDFADMRGQKNLKRACEIAAAGRHHMLLFGPPGVGKTMAAFRIPGLLPPLSRDESIEVTRIYSIGGKLPKGVGLIEHPPFRAPHHTASREGMIGGGGLFQPGEISYAHHGVLVLDEAMQFSTGLLQSLREPIERGTVQIARSGYHYWYPARFQLVLALNPCPCGKLGQQGSVCMCSPMDLHRYWKKLGAAFLDRIDIRVPVEPLLPGGNIGDSGEASGEGETTDGMRVRVASAIEKQHERFFDRGMMRNAEMGPAELRSFCRLDGKGTKILDEGVVRLGLSFRASHSVLKIARTVADLEGNEFILGEHLREALYLRRFADGDYFWKEV